MNQTMEGKRILLVDDDLDLVRLLEQAFAKYIHTYVWRLRRKLEPDPREPRYLLTEHAVGYRFPKSSPV